MKARILSLGGEATTAPDLMFSSKFSFAKDAKSEVRDSQRWMNSNRHANSGSICERDVTNS